VKLRVSKFARADHDFYRTPAKAVPSLIPYLRASGIRTFAEPCCGEGDLIRHLESFGLRCVYRGDIATGQDALATERYGELRFDAIITNPPFSHKRELIAHFLRIAPTWLLLPVDFTCNENAATLMVNCSDVVPIGRVKWIAGTKHGSFENFVWLRFDARHVSRPVIHGRDQVEIRSRSRRCANCDRAYAPQRSTSKFCGNACRQAAYRERLTVTLP
jgi:hypothetical protein